MTNAVDRWLTYHYSKAGVGKKDDFLLALATETGEPPLPEAAEYFFKMRDASLSYSRGGYEDQYYLFQLELEAVQTADAAFNQRIRLNTALAAQTGADNANP